MANNSSEFSLFQAVSNKIDSQKTQEMGEKWGIQNELQQVREELATRARARAHGEGGNGAARTEFKYDAYDKEDMMDKFHIHHSTG
ncbi:hypothetical protein PanWU01x14_302830 [Parasponia andersonii]|uniref:Uncharacterized protein n=1 Tax=Parasponia andersonii TaxID=3476 RepID=A0A2P5ATA6_PARAD|nr:hypothetical protein PanWU01x14_302830 [Parasponia andersonii]